MPEADLVRLTELLRHADRIRSVIGLLGWDEQVNLPPASAPRRAEQLSTLAALAHEAGTAPEIGALLGRLEAEGERLEPDARVIVRHARRDFDRATRLPAAFVARRAALDSEAYHAWKEARERADFAAFAPFLERQVAMAREEAAYLGLGDRPYDHLLDRNDPGMTEAVVAALFDELASGLVPLVRRIVAAAPPRRRAAMRGFPVAAQDAFLRRVVARLGFDFSRGRIDVAVHPFCSGDAADTRMTTRFDEDRPLEALFGAIHETGHGLYEQGLPVDRLGTALGEAVGMAVHESQSRLWENQVGRGRAFWAFFESEFRAAFPGRLDGLSSDELYREINDVRPGPIRVEADEVTYNLHVLLRFTIERRLFAGGLAVADLPAAWNELSRELLGIDPASDAEGVLQDVHWSGGAFGYFPSYCVGNMIAAQLWQAALAALPGLEEDFTRGRFGRLLGWLRETIHRHGRRFSTMELVREVTGGELSPAPLLRHLEERYAPLYLPATR